MNRWHAFTAVAVALAGCRGIDGSWVSYQPGETRCTYRGYFGNCGCPGEWGVEMVIDGTIAWFTLGFFEGDPQLCGIGDYRYTGLAPDRVTEIGEGIAISWAGGLECLHEPGEIVCDTAYGDTWRFERGRLPNDLEPLTSSY